MLFEEYGLSTLNHVIRRLVLFEESSSMDDQRHTPPGQVGHFEIPPGQRPGGGRAAADKRPCV